MVCSQMIWIQNLVEEDLNTIGNIIFVQKLLKDQEEKAKQLNDIDKTKDQKENT